MAINKVRDIKMIDTAHAYKHFLAFMVFVICSQKAI
jgi:hypothetical protein